MSRVFWDAMLFIYLLEGHPQFGRHALKALDRSHQRGDKLLTSYLALGEAMAGKDSPAKMEDLKQDVIGMGFSFLAFDDDCSLTFARLRSEWKLKAQDSINLSAAAAARVDMYLTGDGQLLRRGLHVPGIQFIADFTLPIL